MGKLPNMWKMNFEQTEVGKVIKLFSFILYTKRVSL